MIKLKQLYSSNKPVKKPFYRNCEKGVSRAPLCYCTQYKSAATSTRRQNFKYCSKKNTARGELPPDWEYSPFFLFYCEGDWALEQLAHRDHGASNLGDIENLIATALSNLLWVTLLWAGVSLDGLQRTLPTSATLRFRDLAIYPEQTFSNSVVMNMMEGTGQGSNDFVPLCSSLQKGYGNFTGIAWHSSLRKLLECESIIHAASSASSGQYRDAWDV